MNGENEIVLYQPDDTIRIEVQLQDETVWLNVAQLAMLFGRNRTVISRHIRNIYAENELPREITCANFAHMGVDADQIYETKYYNLDVIISVGYRVKSQRGVQFRQWATSVLKQHLLHGFTISQQLQMVEDRMDRRLQEHQAAIQKIEQVQEQQQKQIDFFVKTALPPAEQVFYNGDIFEARVALERLVKMATRRVIMIDGYVDALTFDILDVRQDGVEAYIYTNGVGTGMKRLLQQHDLTKEHIEVLKWKHESHDRWLIVDDRLYHCGHSFNAIGNHLSAIVELSLDPEEILKQVR